MNREIGVTFHKDVFSITFFYTYSIYALTAASELSYTNLLHDPTVLLCGTSCRVKSAKTPRTLPPFSRQELSLKETQNAT